MNPMQALRERRAARAQDAAKILADHPADKWTKDAEGKVDAIYAEIESIDGQLARHQRLLDLEADDKVKSTDVVNKIKLGKLGDVDPLSPKALFNRVCRVGVKGLEDDELQIWNTLSTTTGSQGGFTVPSLISKNLFDAMKAYGAMRSVAELIPTADGKPLSFPTSDGTAETGEWIAQNITATALDPSFGSVSLNVFKGSSKIVAVPIELLQDSIIDMEGFVGNRLAQRLGRLGNTAFTVGTGTTQPDGIVPKASAGKVGIVGQTLTIIYDDLVDLIAAVDPAYRGPQASFMASDSLLKVIRKLKDTAGRPLWTPSYDAGIRFVGQDATQVGAYQQGGYNGQARAAVYDYLMNYPVWVNNDMAVPAANAKTLIFGDLSYYKIRDAMDVSMFRFTDSVYTTLGQVGFLAWCRMGGNLADVNAVKYYQHSAT